MEVLDRMTRGDGGGGGDGRWEGRGDGGGGAEEENRFPHSKLEKKRGTQ
jgi:hypothetical protein